MTEIDSLKSLIHASVSPYHCILEASRRTFVDAGFTRLELQKPWKLTAGGAYFVPAYDSTIALLCL